MITVPVDLAERSYDVLVGEGARHRLLDVLPFGVQRAVVVTQANIPVEVDPGVEHQIVTIGTGEGEKDLETIETLCRRFAQYGLTRGDVVIAVGGGMVTDVAGFAAAVYHRGVASRPAPDPPWVTPRNADINALVDQRSSSRDHSIRRQPARKGSMAVNVYRTRPRCSLDSVVETSLVRARGQADCGVTQVYASCSRIPRHG